MARWLRPCTRSDKRGRARSTLKRGPSGARYREGARHCRWVHGSAPQKGLHGVPSIRRSEPRQLGSVRDRRRLLSRARRGGGCRALVARGVDPPKTSAQRGVGPVEYCADGVCVPGCRNHRDCRSKHDDPCLLHECLGGVCVVRHRRLPARVRVLRGRLLSRGLQRRLAVRQFSSRAGVDSVAPRGSASSSSSIRASSASGTTSAWRRHRTRSAAVARAAVPVRKER